MNVVAVFKSIKGQDRNILLKRWCDAKDGRTSWLSEQLFPDNKYPKSGLSHYKTTRQIGDDLWNNIIDILSKIDSDDSNVSHVTKPTCEAFYDDIHSWFAFNKKIKLIMCDSIYAFKHRLKRNTTHSVSDLIETQTYVDETIQKDIRMIMKFVDNSIITKDQYYIAASNMT